MPATRAKSQGAIDAFPYNECISLAFAKTALQASQASTARQAYLFLPTAVKIYRVIAGFDEGTVAGTCSINVVLGTAAELTGIGSLPTPDTDYTGQPGAAYATGIAPAYSPPTYPTAGQKLFLSDQALTMTAATATILTPNDSAASGAFAAGTPGNEYDAIWGPGGALLTLRTVTNGSASGNLYVALLCKTYDGNYAKPVLTSFNPATDIP